MLLISGGMRMHSHNTRYQGSVVEKRKSHDVRSQLPQNSPRAELRRNHPSTGQSRQGPHEEIQQTGGDAEHQQSRLRPVQVCERSVGILRRLQGGKTEEGTRGTTPGRVQHGQEKPREAVQ